MDFLLDEDVYHVTGEFLNDKGHSVKRPKDYSISGAADDAILEKAREENKILLTRDKDFGALVFLEQRATNGVILLRINPSNIDLIHENMEILISQYNYSLDYA